MKPFSVAAVGVGLVAVGLSIAVATSIWPKSEQAESQETAAAQPQSGAKDRPSVDTSGAGMAAIAQAAQDKRYLFAFFWKDESSETAEMRGVFAGAVAKMGDRAQAVQIRTTDPAEAAIVAKFDLLRAPLPLVLAIAPNGAVMGGFPQKFTAEGLLNAFGTPRTERCMKSLQDGKLVFLCVQNDKTTANQEALKGVHEFKADSRYAGATEIVMLDPADAAETSFLNDLKIDPKTTEAVTAFLAPPGSVIAEFQGATDKAELIAALQKASTACGPGGVCGPGGCGPQK